MTKASSAASRGGKNNTRNGSAGKSSRQAGPRPHSGRLAEIVGAVIMAVGIIGGYVLWFGGSKAGLAKAVQQIAFGCFGMLGAIAPVLLLALGVLIMFFGRRSVKGWRVLLVLLATLAFCGAFHALFADSMDAVLANPDFTGYVKACYEAGATRRAGAGAAGALTTWKLLPSLSGPGTTVALVCVLIIIAICLSRKSVRQIYADVSDRISDGLDGYRERRQLRGRERAELRAQALEEQMAREEEERKRDEEHRRVMQQERELRQQAEHRAERARARREEANSRRHTRRASNRPERADRNDRPRRPEQEAERRGRGADYSASPRFARIDVRDIPPQNGEYFTPGNREPGAASTPDTVQVDNTPVSERNLEAMKSRARGDSDAHRQSLRDYRMQEGVPMFLDKRIPSSNINGKGSAQPAVQPQYTAHDEPVLQFSGYEEPQAAKNAAAKESSYLADEFRSEPVSTAAHSVLRPEVFPEYEEPAFDFAPQQQGEPQLDMRPLRPQRIIDAEEPHPAAQRASSPQAERALGQVAFDDQEPVDLPTMHDREAVAPATDSAYATGRGYDDAGMPYEKHDSAFTPFDHERVSGTGGLPFNADTAANAGEARASGAPAQAQASAPAAGTAAAYQAAEPQQAEPDEPNDEFDIPYESEYTDAPSRGSSYSDESDSYDAGADDDTDDYGANDDSDYNDTADGDDEYDEPQADVSPRHSAMADSAQQSSPSPDANRPKVGMYTPQTADLPKAGAQSQVCDRDPIVVQQPEAETQPEEQPYFYPPIDLLHFSDSSNGISRLEQQRLDTEKAHKLEDTLLSFGIQAKVVGISRGPAITRFELTPAAGVRVNKISSLSDDIALAMAATTVRIEAPIPGKSAVGIELPNEKREMVTLRDVLESKEAADAPSRLAVALGKDNAGKLIIADIAKMPHVLIAGQTGSGKSVCINTIIMSIIYRATPDEVRLILIDPKVVELSVYNGVPHLLVPVVTDPKKAASALNWAVLEMTDRYKKFAARGVRDIRGYNKALPKGEKALPQIVVIIDELSDLMMVAPGDVEDAICRLAQLARAAGIHLVIATQRPSVNVITGVIKANIPSRIAFTVASQIDSRTILDSAGAEKLLGYGDMLYMLQGTGKPLRVQGANVTDDEVLAVTEFIKNQHEALYNPDFLETLENADVPDAEKEERRADECDELLPAAVELAVESGQISISMLQRRMRIGYARAGRIVDELTQRGIIGESEGAKPRMTLISREEFKRLYADKT